MFKKLSVLIPTRGRVGRLQTLLASYTSTTKGVEVASELVFRVDEDDRETQDYLIDHGGLRVVLGPRMNGYRSLPVFFNEMLLASSGDVLMCGNDDMVFKSLGWAPALLAEANRFPDGLFDLGVRTHNEEHFPFSTISRRAAERMGFVWDPRIFWGDIFLRDVMAWFGRLVAVPAVEIAHDWAGYNPDRVFMDGDEQRVLPRGPQYWEGVHRPAVEEAIGKLVGLTS